MFHSLLIVTHRLSLPSLLVGNLSRVSHLTLCFFPPTLMVTKSLEEEKILYLKVDASKIWTPLMYFIYLIWRQKILEMEQKKKKNIRKVCLFIN